MRFSVFCCSAALSIFIFPFALCSADFSDVSANHENKTAIEQLSSEHILNGYPDGTFRPDAEINRAEFLKIIISATISKKEIDDCISTNLPTHPRTIFFSDVFRNAWFAKYICVAKTHGIVSGYSDKKFKPGNKINFVEAAKILANSFDFSSNGMDEPWYRPFVEELASQHAIPISISGLNKLITRSDAAEMIYRLRGGIETLPSREYADFLAAFPLLDVPFTTQAPTGAWGAPYDEACEEASLVMVHHFLTGEKLTPEKANAEILALIDWEGKNGDGVDIGAEEIAHIAEEIYGLNATTYFDEEVSTDRIKTNLDAGLPVIIPAAGRILANPNYRGDGPPYHVIVLIGYNKTGFISHDPGVTAGASHEYSFGTIENAIHDWTGSKSTAEEGRRAMVVLRN